LIPVWDETSKGLEVRYEHRTSSDAVTRSAEKGVYIRKNT